MSSKVMVEPTNEPDGRAIDEDEGWKEGRTAVKLCSTRRASQHAVDAKGRGRMRRQGSASENDFRRPLSQFITHDSKHGEVGSFALAPPTSPQ